MTPSTGRFISQDDESYLDTESINGLNLYAYCGSDPVNRLDPTGNAWWHWVLGALAVVAIGVALVVTAGGIAPALLAVGMAVSGIASTTMAVTVLSFAFVGAATLFAASAITAGINGISEWANTGSLSSGLETAMDYGETAMWSTIGGGILGGLGGFVSYKPQPRTLTKKVPNPGGRHGGSAHRGKIETLKQNLKDKDWTVNLKESRTKIPAGGLKPYRYADIVATKGNSTIYINVGKATSTGAPIAREARAIADFVRANLKIFFVPYP